MQKKETQLLFYTIQKKKINSEWVEDWNVRFEIIKVLEENRSGTLLNTGFSNDFCRFDTDTKNKGSNKRKQAKISGTTSNQKATVKAMETINKVKGQCTEWEKIFTNHISHKGLTSKVHKELIQLSSKNPKILK